MRRRLRTGLLTRCRPDDSYNRVIGQLIRGCVRCWLPTSPVWPGADVAIIQNVMPPGSQAPIIADRLMSRRVPMRPLPQSNANVSAAAHASSSTEKGEAWREPIPCAAASMWGSRPITLPRSSRQQESLFSTERSSSRRAGSGTPS